MTIDTPTADKPSGSLSAVCATLNCGYSYEESTAEVLTMTVNNLDVSFTGTNMPLDLASVTLGHTNCVIASSDATSISCTLVTPLFAGTWLPEIKDSKGLLPLAVGFAGQTVSLVVSNVTPATDLNPAGGDIITITGSGFPSVISLSSSIFSVMFDDGNVCTLTASSPTQMQCLTEGFSVSRRRNLSDDVRNLVESRTMVLTSTDSIG